MMEGQDGKLGPSCKVLLRLERKPSATTRFVLSQRMCVHFGQRLPDGQVDVLPTFYPTVSQKRPFCHSMHLLQRKMDQIPRV